MKDRIALLIPMLTSSSDGEVLKAARALDKELKDRGSDIHALVRAWEQALAEQPAVEPQLNPVDYGKVESTVNLFVADKTKVRMRDVLKEVHTIAEVRALLDAAEPEGLVVGGYVSRYLQRLGFKRSPSG